MFPDLQWSFPIDQQPYAYSHESHGALQLFNEFAPQPDPLYHEQSTVDYGEPQHPPELSQELLFPMPQDVPSFDDASTSMGPPLKHRKRKARTLRDEDFEPYKNRIIELHVAQKVPLRKVSAMIEEEFGFAAK